MAKKLRKETVEFATRKVMVTNDYEQFKSLNGNRDVSERHVKELIQLMLENGNLTDRFPIIVSKDMYIIDGQHRLAAAKELGWDIAYIVEESANIDTVRAINRGSKNWSWQDVATSFAVLGDMEYRWFLDFTETYGLNFRVALRLTGNKDARHGQKGFYSGDLTIKNKPQSFKFAKQLTEALAIVNVFQRDFSIALHALMLSPNYDHERMIKKLRQYSHAVPFKTTVEDFKRLLEKIYNQDFTQENKTRLF